MKERIREILAMTIVIKPMMNEISPRSIDKAAEEIEKLFPQWVPVSERLPEEYTNCLFLIDSDTEFDYVKGFYFDDKVISGNEIIPLDKITRWMPESELLKLLPERK